VICSDEPSQIWAEFCLRFNLGDRKDILRDRNYFI